MNELDPTQFWKRFTEIYHDAALSAHSKVKKLDELGRSCFKTNADEGFLNRRSVVLNKAISNLNKRIVEGDQLEAPSDSGALSDLEIYSIIRENQISSKKYEDEKSDFGIAVFAHTRKQELDNTLLSLQKQNCLELTEVFFDGDQGKYHLRQKIAESIKIAEKYPVKRIHKQRSGFGFRKMILMSLMNVSLRCRDILVLEDDCFPSRDAVSEFRKELDLIRNDDRVFSVYGSHFGLEHEKPYCTRFQGWGWATTSEKLIPILRMLYGIYSLDSNSYDIVIQELLTQDVRSRLDVTPGRQPTDTLEKFFAWDETLALLTAVRGQVHRPTERQVIFNCGLGEESTHFPDLPHFRQPPFNMIHPREVWDVF